MNPEVQELISRVLANEIPIDVFYARMGQLGVLPSEAQTMLSQAAGGTPQGLDPSLASDASQPVEQSAYNYAPPQTATVSRDTYAPRESIAERVQRGPLARGINSLMGQTPAAPAGVGNGPGPGAPGSGAPFFSQVRPSTGGAAAGNMIANALPPTNAPERAREVLAEQSYYGSDDAAPGAAFNMPAPYPTSYYSMDGSEMSPTYGQTPAVDRALVAARSAAPQRQVSSAQTTAPQQQGPQSGADMSPLAYFIRGRFGEAGKGSPFDDRLTAAQEARDRMGENRASGGQVNSKGGKGDAVHKALEIIQQLLSNR